MRRNRARPTGCFLLLLALGVIAGAAVASGAAAQDSAPQPVPAAAEPAAYASAIAGAIEEYQAGHFAEARALFSRAHGLLPNARTMRGLGMVEFELRNYASSVHWLEQAMASTVKPLDPTLRAQTAQLLERSRGFVGRFTLRLQPASARVLVDGVAQRLGDDHVLELEVGDHRLEISAPGRASDQRTVRVNGGEWVELAIALPEQARLTPTRSPGGARNERGERGERSERGQRDDDGGSVFSSPWFWLAVGAVAIGAGVGAGIALSKGETREQKPYGGDTDVVLSGP